MLSRANLGPARLRSARDGGTAEAVPTNLTDAVLYRVRIDDAVLDSVITNWPGGLRLPGESS